MVWTEKARSDAQRLHAFLKPVAPKAAHRVFQALVRAPRPLAQHPRLGQRIEGHEDREVRRLIVGDYELQYEVTQDTVYVVRIWHGREYR